MLYLFARNAEAWLAENNLDWAFKVLYQVQFRALAAAGLAFLIVLLLGKRTIRILTRMKIGDTGATDAELLRAQAKSKANVPTMGGVLIAGAILISCLLLADITQFYAYAGIFVLLWMAALGGVDDYLKLTSARRGSGSRQGLYAWEKLVFQLGIGVLIGLFAYTHGGAGPGMASVLNLPFQKTYLDQAATVNPALWYLPKAVFIFVMVLMIAGMSNAVNITDGMDGLAGGISAAVSLGLCILALVCGTQAWAQYLLVPYVQGSEELAVMAGATAGACLGFLWWNCSPAQVFMGDTGSLCLGGLIGYIAVVTRQELVTLLMCGVFLLEITSVVMQVGYFKASGGKRIFRCAPFHHHLHLIGWTEPQIVARAWIVSILLVVAALASIKLR
ncbi:MAG: phospho-N-acetylmuramoyl-pentapeptide-transferase [Phycisphaeraceae bacterium]|nr:phospho-N-acetylmuramoyl-pentapeptide-transferase [Phycisphaeraceae bacterium]